jgi:diguanylate cyclase (GGDEF)-like protein
LTVEAVRSLVHEYQIQYNRRVYFVDTMGRITLSADPARPTDSDLKTVGWLPWSSFPPPAPGGSATVDYRDRGSHFLVSIRYIPELKWYLVVEKDEGHALEGIQSVLWWSLALCLGATLAVVVVFWMTAGGYQRRLETQAWTDPLTSLANRQALDVGLEQILREVKKSRESLALGMIDADHFKTVNDRFGHSAGDESLRNLAGLLGSGIREGDLIGRWGGEEFLILLRHCSLDDAQKRFAALVETVDHGLWKDPRGAVTVSIGVAPARPSDTVSTWLARADRALYRAKEAGRHRVEVEESAP